MERKRNPITEGIIWKELLIFFFPVVIGTLFQQLYNTIDAVIVGRFVGKVALAAAGGSAAIITTEVIMLFTSLSTGAGVIISQYYGANEKAQVSKSLHTAFLFFIFLSIALSIAGVIFSPAVLRMMNTTKDVLPSAIIYMRIYFLGITATFLYNISSAVMRSIGDSKRPLYYLIICTIINIILDILFVIVFHMGIAGAAIATVIAQSISAILAVRALMTSYETLRLDFHLLKIDRSILLSELKIGVPGAIQTLMYGLTNFFIQISVNSLGTDVTAAWAATGKVDQIYWAISTAFGAALATFVGQNYGAGKMKRVWKSVRTALFMDLILGGSILAGLLLFSKYAFGLFSNDANVVKLGIYILQVIVPYYIVYIFIEMTSSALRGLGDVQIPTLIVMFGVLLRLPWLFFYVAKHKTLFALLLSYPISWIPTMTLLVIYYFYRKYTFQKKYI